jgi:hypothetical protein
MTILILRGHIRSSFDNNQLYELVKLLHTECGDLEIYIHTWNIVQNDVSWRKMETRGTRVDDAFIYSYFGDLARLIKFIMIDDDSQIKLTGRTDGHILPEGKDPIIGWKRYWYGKYQVIDHLMGQVRDETELVINCRFDILDNSNSFKTKDILFFVRSNIKKTLGRNVFFTDTMLTDSQKQKYRRASSEAAIIGATTIHRANVSVFAHDTLFFYGIDNLYLGNIQTLYVLINHFHTNLDDIIERNLDAVTQEFLVPLENGNLFPLPTDP